MLRVACFAHYDKNNKIEDYVVYYLRELHKIADRIIFVSDSYINEDELKKIEPYVFKIFAEPHGEYDFGSYKRGFLFAKENKFLDKCDELVFANDSCYAPLFTFEEIFKKMSKEDVDFWGASENKFGYKNVNGKYEYCFVEHIQSYFLVFKKCVFSSDIFINFINSIHKLNDKIDVIYKYEIGLSKLLISNNFRFNTYSEICKNTNTINGCVLEYRRLIEQERFPFLKRSIALYKNIDIVSAFGIKKLISKNTDYNFELIKSDRKNNINTAKIKIIFNLLIYLRRKIIRLSMNNHDQRLIVFNKTIFNISKNNKES